MSTPVSEETRLKSSKKGSSLSISGSLDQTTNKVNKGTVALTDPNSSGKFVIDL